MANLTQAETDALIAKLEYYKYVAAAGTTALGPLANAPKVEADVEQKDTVLYETGSEAQASILSKNNVKVTIETRNVAAAMTLLASFQKGDNILDETKKVALTLVPITDDTTAKTITFSRAFLQPGLSMTLGEGEENPNAVSLVYLCKPDATTKKPFAYA